MALTACSGGAAADNGAKRADYLVKAEAVCAQANAAQKRLTTPMAALSFSPYIDAVVKIAAESTTALLALTPPAKDRTDLDKHVFTPLQRQLKTAQAFADKVRTATRAHDQIALVKLLNDPPNKPAADLAWMRSYGFKECVDAADTSS
jgi:hypothetical protein